MNQSLRHKPRLIVLSGAGISAESGIKTFRASDGLWENHRVEEVASPDGFRHNPELVMRFYNERRRQLRQVQPNTAHLALADLQSDFHVIIITQNVDDLHERAGSQHVIHLHGELRKARPIDSNDESLIIPWDKDLHWGDTDHRGIQLRPHIVWFGESVPQMEQAIRYTTKADFFLIIGTSLRVYPAAGLMDYMPSWCRLWMIDPQADYAELDAEHCLRMTATEGMAQLAPYLRSLAHSMRT